MTTKAAGKDVNPLRELPSVDELLRAAGDLTADVPDAAATTLAREAVDVLRREIVSGDFNGEPNREALLGVSVERFAGLIRRRGRGRLLPVINATGVVIHTNLGRAPLSEQAIERLAAVARGYSTLEFDLETGERGARGQGAERLICELTGAEAAVIVNNCAAAAFLVLKVFAEGGEVVISRGELVEIGGDFRVPDVLTQSGGRLREVGTTNRTKLSDYEKAIGDDTRMLLRVHTSNYRVIGFTESPTDAELARLADERGLVFFHDAGSGALRDLTRFGLGDEPLISRTISDGAGLVAFSGDKLLGGPQAGIIAGRKDLVARVRRHPLYRTLRADKLVYAVLEATLASYADEREFDDVPVLKMLSATPVDLATRSEKLLTTLKGNADLRFEIAEGNSVIGGGSAPGVEPATTLIAVTSEKLSADDIADALRRADPPVIARIADGRVLLDLRTVFPDQEDALAAAVNSLS